MLIYVPLKMGAAMRSNFSGNNNAGKSYNELDQISFSMICTYDLGTIWKIKF